MVRNRSDLPDRLNCSVRSEDRTNGEMTETGGEARIRQKGGKWIILDQKGKKSLHRVEIGSSVGEVNPLSKCADGAGSWDTTASINHNRSVCAGRGDLWPVEANLERSRLDQTEHCIRRQPLGT